MTEQQAIESTKDEAAGLTVSTDEIDRAVDILDKSLRDSLDEMAIAGRA